MRISDWSSDVCSSDLAAFAAGPGTSQQEEAMSGQKHAAVLPTEGRPWEEIRRSLLDAKRCDYNWREGRLPLYVYYNDEALLKVSRAAFNLYFSENALGRKAFPSMVQLEADIVSMALRLFNAGDERSEEHTSDLQ